MAKTTKKIRLVRQNNADPVNGNFDIVAVNAPKFEKQIYLDDVPEAGLSLDDIASAYNTLLGRYKSVMQELDAAGIIELME